MLDLGETVVRGQIDLLRRPRRRRARPSSTSRPTRSADGRRRELGERYAVQRQVYALAAGGGGRASAGRSTSSSRRPTSRDRGPSTPSGWRRRASTSSALIGRMRARRVRGRPRTRYAALCFGCPAAARLCPHPKWKPAAGERRGSPSSATPRSSARRAPRRRSAAPVEFVRGRAPARLGARLDARPRQAALGEDLRPRRRLACRASASALNLDPDRDARGAQRRPDRAHRGGARAPRPARDPLPTRVDVTDAIAVANGAPRLRPRAHLHRQARAPPPHTARRRDHRRHLPGDGRGRVRRARPGQLELFRATTAPIPVEVIEATLVRDRIPAGNPRDW